jgi:hypothetical protein
LIFVAVKLLKYSNGGKREDVPWAILIVLGAGLICGFLWQLVRTLCGPAKRRVEDKPPSEADDS